MNGSFPSESLQHNGLHWSRSAQPTEKAFSAWRAWLWQALLSRFSQRSVAGNPLAVVSVRETRWEPDLDRPWAGRKPWASAALQCSLRGGRVEGKTEKVAGEGLPHGWRWPLNCPEGALCLGLLPPGSWETSWGSSLYCCYCCAPCCSLVSWEEFAGWNVQVTEGGLGKVERRVREKALSLELSPRSRHSGLHQLCGHHVCDD